MHEHEFIESREEMETFLREEELGYLGLTDQDGRPYVVPLNYSYHDGKVLFHCAREGRKLDCIRANPNVCFTVGRQAGALRRHAVGEVCHMDSDSVDIPAEQVEGCGVVEITISEMTGRRERERKRTLWQYRF